ncbi:lachnocin family radical SAM-modified peptide [Clostridium sp. Marseille-QA1073]
MRKVMEIMRNNKVSLEKLNKANNSTVRTLGCRCCCAGKPMAAYGSGYIGQFLN